MYFALIPARIFVFCILLSVFFVIFRIVSMTPNRARPKHSSTFSPSTSFYAITHEEVCVKSKIYERKISQEKKENFEKRGGN